MTGEFISLKDAERLRRQELKPPPNDVPTEDSAALMFVDRHGESIRYCHSTGAWFIWDGVTWKPDQTGWVLHSARELARELGEDQNTSVRKTIGKTSFAAGIERFSRADPRMAVTIDYWDADPLLLGTPGGTVELRTGKLRAPQQQDGITKTTLVTPLETGCLSWLRFLEEATGNDADLIRFLQQWCGYCLTGLTREHALVFVYGPGGNGKSVFVNVVTTIFKDYSRVSAMETFTASHSDKHPTDLAMLRGARLVTASETEEGRPWAEARIKQLTGGDRISARFMRQDFFEFTPQFKLTIVGNHKPILRNIDDAARRRFNIVPFVVKPREVDAELESKLLREAPGILQWMIEGCRDWQTNGLIRPASVLAATEEYFSDQDLFGHWIDEACDAEPGNVHKSETSSDLFRSWREYAQSAGTSAGSQQSFKDQMLRHGFQYIRTRKAREFFGIRLKPRADYHAG